MFSRISRSGLFASLVLLLALSNQLVAQDQDKAAPRKLLFTTSSDEAKMWYERALFSAFTGFGPRAAERTRLVLEMDPKFAYARAGFGFLTNSPAELNRAVADAANASLGELLEAAALRERQAGRLQNAAVLTRAAAELYPADPYLAINLAFLTSPPAQRAEAYMAIAEKFNSGPAWRQASGALLMRGDTAGALSAAEKFMATSPDAPQPHLWYGLLKRWTGDDAAARAHIGKALELVPDFVDAHGIMAETEQLSGNVAAARTHIGHALTAAITPFERNRVRHWQITSYVEEGNYKQALAELGPRLEEAKAANDVFNIRLAHRNSAWLSALLKRPANEVKAHLQAAASAGDPPLVHNLHATLTYAEIGMLPEAKAARDAYVAAAGANPGEVVQRNIHFLHGLLSLSEGNAQDAITHLRQSDTDNLLVQLVLARAHKKLGQKAEVAKLKAQILGRRYFNLNQVPQAVARAEARKL